MRPNGAKPPRDVRLAALAARQHGVVTRAQLAALGINSSAIRRRKETGRLHQLYRNVYAVGHTDVGRRGYFLAAVLAYGRRAVLSHRAAAVMLGILERHGERIDVTVPSGGSRPARGPVRVHRSPLGPGDTTTRERIPLTTAARTLVDLADCCGRRELERAMDEAAYLGFDLSSVRPSPGRRGAGLLRQLMEEHESGTTRTKSEFEERLLAVCREHKLPQPLVNQVVAGLEVDFVWPGARLIVEADSWSAHRRRSNFERDRARDARLQVAGWRVVRVTWRRLAREPAAVCDQLRALIAERRSA